MELIYFSDHEDFAHWLQEYHLDVEALWVGIYKQGSQRSGIKIAKAREMALCFGWVESNLQRIDEESYKVRFSPRKNGSSWSANNILLAEALIREGRMKGAGLKAYRDRKPDEEDEDRHHPQLPSEMQSVLENDAAAWEFFQSLSPSMQKTSLRWVVKAKRSATRATRFQTLLSSCQAGERIPPFQVKKP